MVKVQELFSIARGEYERIRGEGSWDKDKAWRFWYEDAYLYLNETEIRVRSQKLAEAQQPPPAPVPPKKRRFSLFRRILKPGAKTDPKP